MEPLHAVFDGYKLDDLDRSWINQVYDSGFVNIDYVPVDYLMFLTSIDMLDLLKETLQVVKDWISKNRDEITNERNEVSWETLIALNVEVQGLLAILAFLMKKGQSFDADQEARQSCLRATSLYFVLLAIPGSNAFQAFQPNLYEIALKTLELSKRLSPTTENISRSRDSDGFEDFTNNEKDDKSCTSLTKSQSINLTRGLNAVMYDLVIMLESTCTTIEIRLLEITIYHLIEMTKLANEMSNEFRCNAKNDSILATTNSLAHNAYVALEKICNPKYSSVGTAARLIAKYALPQFLIGNVNLPPKQLTIIRESTLYFMKNLLTTHGHEAQSAITILIQHTMLKCPDRLDGRQKQAAIIVKLFNLCHDKENAHDQCIRDLVRLSHHGKISCRIFAQEIIGKFLVELSTWKTMKISSMIDTKKILLACALGRCVDASSMVRGRAIATIAEFTDSIDSPEVKNLFSHRENIAREMPNLEKLENAIETGNVDSLLPEMSGIIAMLRNRLDDERALVRRSALQILRNAILVLPELLANSLPIIRDHCRDSICTVRRFAIRVLTTLLEKFPATPKFCEYWVESVVPRVFDSEAKVQEEVLDSLEKLTISKIVNEHFEEETKKLPWKILRAIASNRMGDHLAKACSIWIKSESITDRTIIHVKSHIETENNVEAWLLLASMSENKMLLGMKNYFDSCSVYVDSENSNVFLASCSLRVLKNCWRSFDELTLRRISRELTEYLKKWRIKVALIRLCMDILLQITRHLENLTNENEMNEENSDIMADLVRLSEATIARIDMAETDENWGKIIFRAICTLGHASFLSWAKISLETRRMLQGFLLEWKSLPDGLKGKRELQGVAVAVLGQQALIDRETATEMTPIFGRLLCNRRDESHEKHDHDEHENIATGTVVRINAAKALADICVRFTSLVEPYLPDMCISMKDPDPNVRQVILVIFIQLLVEDTIKINEAFFFHILTMLADVDTTIRDMTVFLIKERLLAKNKQLITQQFINGIYRFNDYERRTSSLNRRRKISSNDDRMSLAGAENTAKRRMIYDFMLENLDPSGKLAIVGKLTGQILSTRQNRELDVKCEKGICIVRDVLYVVSSENLQVNSSTRQFNDDDHIEEGGNSTVSSVIAEAMKKHRIQIFLPNLVELKRRCEELESPLIEDVAKFLIRCMSDCGREALTSLYNEYPKLDQEIQRDIRKYAERTRAETPEKSEEESSDTDESAGIQKLSLQRHSMLINPDRMPKIVLRRLSTLTYPGIAGCSRKSSNESLENSSDDEAHKNSTTNGQPRLQSPRKRSRR